MSAFVATPKRSKLVVLVLALVSLLVCCGPIRLVSPYDQVIDEGVTAFYAHVTGFVGKMETLAGKPEGTYEANKASYPELSAELSSLRMHAAQTPLNDSTVKSLDELIGSIERLRQLHASGGDKGLFPALADPALKAIEVQCESIVKLEIAKRRGEEPK
jgi:hypothetical protein